MIQLQQNVGDLFVHVCFVDTIAIHFVTAVMQVVTKMKTDSVKQGNDAKVYHG